MILIPEQTRLLLQELVTLDANLAKLDDYRASQDTAMLEILHITVPTDSFSDYSFDMNRKRKETIERTLNSATLLNKRITSKIEIGTRFLFQFLGEEEICDFILVEDAIGVSSTKGFISQFSPVGKMLVGKKEGDKVENVGTVLRIKKEYNDYVHYIREKAEHLRTCNQAKKQLKELKRVRKWDENAKREWQNWHTITLSQKSLLEYEKRTLLCQTLNDSKKCRLREIEKILKSSQIAQVPEDGTIGIGSKFSVMVFTEKGPEIKQVELINQAIGLECDKDYVERISSLGFQVFGLQNNQKFICQYDAKSNHYIRGVVFDVDNSKNQLKTTSALTYQKNLAGRK